MRVEVVAQGMCKRNENLMVSNLKVRANGKVVYATFVKGGWCSLYLDSQESEENIIPLSIYDVKDIMEEEIIVGYDSNTDENELGSVKEHLEWVMFCRQF